MTAFACLFARMSKLGLAFTLLLAGSQNPAAAGCVPDLPKLVRDAKARFRPLTDADLDARKKDLAGAVNKVESRLKADGENGDTWRRYLRIEQLRDELGKDKPNVAVLAKSYERFVSGYDGLWLNPFNQARQALMRYLQTSNSLAAKNLEADYQNVLERLAVRLESFEKSPSPDEAWQIGLSLRLLSDLDQATDVIKAVRQRYDSPNVYFAASRRLVGRNSEGQVVDDVTAVNDCILGATIVGTGVTNGQKVVELVPSDELAVIDTVFRGTTNSNTTAYKGKVQVYSAGVTELSATKRVWLSAAGVGEYPATAQATTCTRFTGLCARSQMVEKIAWKKAYQQKGQAEYVAARHAERQLRGRVDKEAVGPVDQLRDGYENKFRKPLVEHETFPEALRFATKAEEIQVVALRAAAHQLAAGAVPPDAPKGDLSVRLHESTITNVTDQMLSGMTVRQESVRTAATRYLGKTPEGMQDETEDQVAIKFPAGMAPVAVRFVDDTISILIRGERIYKNYELISSKLKIVDITATYKIEPCSDGFKLVRQGEVEVLPTGFKREEGKPLSAEVIVVRNALKTQLEKAFKPERPLVIDLPKDRGPGGRLLPTSAQARNGWLSLAWKLEE